MYRVVVNTKDMEHSEWLRYRRSGIGGSDAGAICGLNPYVSPMMVYFDKVSEGSEKPDNESMRQGRDLENYVAERFCEETGLKVRRKNQLLQSIEHPCMLANIDRMIVGENAGLECKTASAYSEMNWKDGRIPEHYQIQCHHYMAVTGATAWYIAVVILGREFKYHRIERDEELIQNLTSMEEYFWNEYVSTNKMPDPDGSRTADEIINQYFRSSDEEKNILLDKYEEQLRRRDEITEIIGRLDTERHQIDQKIKLAMADAEKGVTSGHIVTWKSYQMSKLDTDRLKQERPDIYQTYCKEIPVRKFTVKAA